MKYYYLLLLLFFYGISNASVPRKPLMEEMTSTTCSFCDISDSLIMAWETVHGDGMCTLKWFNDWKNHTGADPFFHAFPEGANRTFYYGVTGVPAVCMNGGNVINPYGTTSVEKLDSFYSKNFTMTSPYQITVGQKIIGDSIYCTVNISLVDNVSVDTSLRIGIVIAERIIYFQEQTDYQYASPVHTNVVRATLPAFTSGGAASLKLPALKQNSMVTFSFNRHIDSQWNKNMLRTVAFIQSNRNGEVIQSESSPIENENVHNDRSSASLSAIYPNPVSQRTTISFSLSEAQYVAVTLFDVHGSTQEVIYEGGMEAGRQSLSFDASHLRSGVYFYRLQIGDHIEMKPLIVEH